MSVTEPLELLLRHYELLLGKGVEDQGEAPLLLRELDLSEVIKKSFDDFRVFKPIGAIICIILYHGLPCDTSLHSIISYYVTFVHMTIFHIALYYIILYHVIVYPVILIYISFSSFAPRQQVPEGGQDLMPPEAHDVLRLGLGGILGRLLLLEDHLRVASDER